jgi:hypothetical protein
VVVNFDKIKTVLALLVIVCAVLFLVVSCVGWQWGECRQVGHGVAYCALQGAK